MTLQDKLMFVYTVSAVFVSLHFKLIRGAARYLRPIHPDVLLGLAMYLPLFNTIMVATLIRHWILVLIGRR